MEMVIRATFEPPTDVVALDDIKYEAILCGWFFNNNCFGRKSNLIVQPAFQKTLIGSGLRLVEVAK